MAFGCINGSRDYKTGINFFQIVAANQSVSESIVCQVSFKTPPYKGNQSSMFWTFLRLFLTKFEVCALPVVKYKHKQKLDTVPTFISFVKTCEQLTVFYFTVGFVKFSAANALLITGHRGHFPHSHQWLWPNLVSWTSVRPSLGPRFQVFLCNFRIPQ